MEREDLIQIITEILSEQTGSQAHVNDIAVIACNRNIHIKLTAEDLAKRISSILASEVKKKQSKFARVLGKKNAQGKASYKKGVYRLKKTVVKQPEPIVPTNSDTAYIGKAGEYAVMSELLFWGFNVSLMSVDQGIDVIASKDNKFFFIQVKTATKRNDDKFFFSIRKSSFESNNSGSTYYVFLMREGAANAFAIFPSSHLDTQRKIGAIKDGDTTISFTINKDQKKGYAVNNQHNIDLFINNFSLIK